MAVGFPMGSEKIEVCLKPHARIDDHQFKLAFMQNLYKARQYDQVWLFENEPVNINLITKHFPETRVVFIDTNHCGQENVAAHHFKIKNFL